MIYKTYGKTGKNVSAVGFGGMRFDETKSIQENAELIRYANKMGINYFDTAPGYCSDTSEDIFGEAFKDMPGEYYVSTKGMPERFDTAEKAIEGVKTSLKRLGVPKIHFYHIWCIRKDEEYELAMKPGGMYEGLLKCQQEGLIEHIVLSSHQRGNQVKRVLEEGKVEGILLGVNILNFPYRWEGVETANKMEYGVVAMNPLAGGMIPTHEKEFAFLADNVHTSGETATEAALRFVISSPQITVALNGFTTKEHIDMACRIADESKPFTNEDIKRISEMVGSAMNEACTGCGYCDECPVDISIPNFLLFYNEKHLFNYPDQKMKEMANDAYQWGVLAGIKGTETACIECGLCEEKCTQHLPIIARLKEFTRWENLQ